MADQNNNAPEGLQPPEPNANAQANNAE